MISSLVKLGCGDTVLMFSSLVNLECGATVLMLSSLVKLECGATVECLIAFTVLDLQISEGSICTVFINLDLILTAVNSIHIY